MNDSHVSVITIELEGEPEGATIVVRDPFGASPRIAVVGRATPAAVQAALERLGLSGAPRTSEPASVGALSVRGSQLPAQTLEAPVSIRPDPLRAEALPQTLFELVAAVLRAGRSAPTSSVDEALEAVRRHVTARGLPCMARLLGRLASALEDPEGLGETTLLLAALGRAARRMGDASDAEAAELAERSIDEPTLAELELVEVGRLRERAPTGWETRLLIEPASGERMRECNAPGRGALSLGPIGRKLFVSFGQRLVSAEPARVRIFHYEFRPVAHGAELERVLAHARRSLEIPRALLDDPLSLVALPRPDLFAPARVAVAKGGAVTLFDDQGHALAVTDFGSAGATEALIELVERGRKLSAICGALVVGDRGIALEPWTAWLAPSSPERSIELAQLAL